jgi:hypothetical protein
MVNQSSRTRGIILFRVLRENIIFAAWFAAITKVGKHRSAGAAVFRLRVFPRRETLLFQPLPRRD